jgi:predicted SAM-dependent methyltransferase
MKLTLNVGCGDRTFPEYPAGYDCINYDERADLRKVDEVGDVRDLSRFPDEHFDYILASDIIEHFPIAQTDKVLTEWKRVLKQGGIIEFRMPNLRVICEKYVKGTHDAKHTSWLLYGGQGYSGNFHYVGFDKKWFSSILVANGFEVISYEETGNNFEIKGRKLK